MFDYNFKSIIEAYRNVGLSNGRVVYVTGNFGRLGRYERNEKSTILNSHLIAIKDIIGEKGTIVVPTHSWKLCNTNKVFDIHSIPSETGPFTEYIRQQKDAVRQFHPFSSSTALGKEAVDICMNNSRHVYGLESPFQRMVDRDALYVSVGKPMESTISLVHHIEFLMGVPYRYTKEFLHPCLVDGKVKMMEFYLYVTRKKCEIVRDKNNKIMDAFNKSYTLNKTTLGRSCVESLSTADFYQSTKKVFSKDIYVWLKRPPLNRPYRQ